MFRALFDITLYNQFALIIVNIAQNVFLKHCGEPSLHGAHITYL